MALVLADRVQQSGTANTTVSFTLSGSVTGFQSFAVIGDANTTYYTATDTSGNWEVGIGTYSTSGPTLTRTTILSSSNSGSAVTFSGTVNVFVTYPSSRSVYADGTTLTATNSSVLPITSGGTGQTTLAAASIATYTGTETLTNKTIEAGTFTNGYTEEVATANTSTAYTIDLAGGTVQILTLTGNCTYTFPTPVAGKSFILIQKQDGTGSRTVTWPASVDWPSATAPTLTATASKADKFVFTAIDGSNWLGSVAGQNYTV